MLLIGAVLGVYGLLGWRPDTMWILVGLAIVSSSVADAVFAVQEAEARAVVSGDTYDFIWTAGRAPPRVWRPGPGRQRPTRTRRPVTGMRAVALALFAQALAIGIQIYAIFNEIGRSERSSPSSCWSWRPCRSS